MDRFMRIGLSLGLLIIVECTFSQVTSVHVGSAIGASYAAVDGNHLGSGSPGLAYAISLQVERKIFGSLSGGVGCAFQSEASTFSVSRIALGTDDNHLSLAYSLTRRSLLFPLLIDVGTSATRTRGFHFLAGVSAIISLPSDRRIDSAHYYYGTTTRSLLVEDKIRLEKENGSTLGLRCQLGIAKELLVGDRRLRLKLAYAWDGDRWLYPTMNDPFNSHIVVKGHTVEFCVDWQL